MKLGTPNIVERARKLHAHAKSATAIGNTEEAAAYAAKAQALCEEYAIAQSELEGATEEYTTIAVHTFMPGYRYRANQHDAWEGTLSLGVSVAFGCAVLVSSASNGVWFVGTRVEAEAAARVYATLHAHGEKASRKAQADRRAELHQTAGHGNTGTYRASWLLAYAEAIYRRLTAPPSTEAAQGRGLMVQRREAAWEWVKRRDSTGRAMTTATYKDFQLDRKGVLDGYSAGQDVEVGR